MVRVRHSIRAANRPPEGLGISQWDDDHEITDLGITDVTGLETALLNLSLTPFEVKDPAGQSSLQLFGNGEAIWAELTTRPNLASGLHYGEAFYAMMERGTKAAPLPVQNGDSLGGFGFGGRGTTGKVYGGAQIIGLVTAPAGTGATSGQIQTDLIFATRNLGQPISERVRIKSNGMLGIGTTTPTCRVHAVGGNNGDLARFEISAGSGFTVSGQLVGSDFAQSTVSGTLLSYNPEGLGSNFVARYSRGTLALPAPVQLGDTLGSLRFAGYSGTDNRPWARISGVVDGTVQASNVPTAIAFFTGPFSDSVEQMRLSSNGMLGIGTLSPTARLEIVARPNEMPMNIASAGIGGRMVLAGYEQTTGVDALYVELKNFNNFGSGEGIYLTYSRGTETVPLPVQLGDNIARLAFSARGNTATVVPAFMEATVDGVVSANQVPTALRFYTGQNNAPAERMRISSAGNIGIGTSAPNAAALLDLTSTTRGLLFPRMTTTQRDAIATPPDGLALYNSTTNKLQVRAAGIWVDLH